jgi:hypothetical protein
MWQIFNTQAEAQAYADHEAEALPRGPGDVTIEWADPQQLADGRWVVSCMDGDGMEWQEDWVLPVSESTIGE